VGIQPPKLSKFQILAINLTIRDHSFAQFLQILRFYTRLQVVFKFLIWSGDVTVRAATFPPIFLHPQALLGLMTDGLASYALCGVVKQLTKFETSKAFDAHVTSKYCHNVWCLNYNGGLPGGVSYLVRLSELIKSSHRQMEQFGPGHC